MIRSVKDRRVQSIAAGQTPKGFPPDVARSARRKLLKLDDAVRLSDLASPPANRLEALKGDRAGHRSVRISDQWRLCFTWHEGGADDVEIVDYP